MTELSPDAARRELARRHAAGTIKMLFWGGLALAVVGAVLVMVSWPTLEVDGLGGAEATGSQTWVAVGWMLVGLGNLGAAIGVVGFGVKLGREASRGL